VGLFKVDGVTEARLASPGVDLAEEIDDVGWRADPVAGSVAKSISVRVRPSFA
jgi:hypothetical protein